MTGVTWEGAGARLDLLGELWCRGLDHLVETVLVHTDADTVAACSCVCRSWARCATQWLIKYMI